MSQKNIVAITRFDDTIKPLRKAIDLCNGFEKLKPGDSVLLKPNIVWGGGLIKGMPKFGFVGTARILEDIIILLHEQGCEKISIGEAATVNKELKSHTRGGFKWIGIKEIAKKYGVSLIDFNKETFNKVDLSGTPANICASIKDHDFLIDVPVFKTHQLTHLSLGMKNLKGCLDMPSKKKFHKVNLHRLIALLTHHIQPDLTVIDGIYALEKGPSPNGIAHRMNMIVAGQDVFSVDTVAASIVGIDPTSIKHFREYSSISGRPIGLTGIEVRGETIKKVEKKIEWKSDLTGLVKDAGIKGMAVQASDETICTGCFTAIESFLTIYCADINDLVLDNMEICVGSASKPGKDSKKAFLAGNCAIAANKDLENTVPIKGCPPSLAQMYPAIIMATVKKNAKKIIVRRLAKSIGTQLGIYKEDLSHTNYSPPDFDEGHYGAKK
ncbi:MAG: DUF362 domain-containing protein [bacterium]|nr:DUF362 domain-containing protein [bacterium]